MTVWLWPGAPEGFCNECSFTFTYLIFLNSSSTAANETAELFIVLFYDNVTSNQTHWFHFNQINSRYFKTAADSISLPSVWEENIFAVSEERSVTIWSIHKPINTLEEAGISSSSPPQFNSTTLLKGRPGAVVPAARVDGRTDRWGHVSICGSICERTFGSAHALIITM